MTNQAIPTIFVQCDECHADHELRLADFKQVGDQWVFWRCPTCHSNTPCCLSIKNERKTIMPDSGKLLSKTLPCVNCHWFLDPNVTCRELNPTCGQFVKEDDS